MRQGSYEFKKSSVIVRCFLALFFCMALSACQEKSSSKVDISFFQVGEHKFYIPKPYVTSIGDESLLLESYYPGGAPVLRTWQELKDQGNVHKTITILMTDLSRYGNFTPEKKLMRRINDYKLTEISKEYGLTRRKPKTPQKNYRYELWVESPTREDLSFIECKKDNEAVTPQCNYRFHNQGFQYKVTLDKRLLPEWQHIRTNVLNLIDSFNAEKTAYLYYQKQFSQIYNEQMRGVQ